MNILLELLKLLIESFYEFTGDYGIAIVCITLLVRTLLVPLDVKQRKQMKVQQEINKKTEGIKAKYKNNQKKMEEELQKVYQEHGSGMGACIIPFLTLPVMIALYNAIRMISTVTCTTVLLPWISSLLVRDHYFVMPIVTILVQMIPQLYPYMRLFKTLKLQKQPISSVLVTMAINSIYLFLIPAGVGLYSLTSAIYQMIEQFVFNLLEVKKIQMA